MQRSDSMVKKITNIFGMILRIFCRKKKPKKKTDDDNS